MTTTLQITTSPANFTIDETGPPSGMEVYSLHLDGGTADGANIWCEEGGTIQLDNDTDISGDATFGFTLHVGGVWENYFWQQMVVTLVGTEA